VGRRDIEAQLLDQPRQPWRLTLGQVEHEPRQGRRVDDGMLERALQAAPHQPGVEGIVAVLDQHRPLRETKESTSRVFELWGADQHRAIDVMALARVRVDRRAAVDERVEEGERAFEGEPLGADLEDQERRIAGRLDVEGDELRIRKRSLLFHLGRVDRDLLPGDQLGRASGLEIQGLGGHQRDRANARRAHAISSPVNPLSTSTATA
jgi:hypothetical protein